MNIDEINLKFKEYEFKEVKITKENGRYRGEIQLSDPNKKLSKKELKNILSKLTTEINLFSEDFTKSINQGFPEVSKPIKKYKKKPVVIQAIQYTGDSDNLEKLKEFVTCGFKKNKDNTLTVPTLEGEHIASIGDYIIKGVEGEFYPCKPRIFKKTYEEVSD
jgi:hypothetical protein